MPKQHLVLGCLVCETPVVDFQPFFLLRINVEKCARVYPGGRRSCHVQAQLRPKSG